MLYELSGVCKRFNKKVVALRGVDLVIREGDFLAIQGATSTVQRERMPQRLTHRQGRLEMVDAVNTVLRSGRTSRRLAFGGLVGPAVFVLSFVVAGLIRPGYSPVHQAVSDLGVGSNAWLVDGSIVLCSLLLIGLVVAFFRAMREVMSEGWRWASAGLLSLSPVGFAIAGVFTEAPATLAVHWVVGAMLAFFGPVIAFTLAGIRLWRDAGWRGWGAYSIASGLVTLALILFLFWVYTPGTILAPERLGGLIERIAVVEILAWYAATGWRLSRAHGFR